MVTSINSNFVDPAMAGTQRINYIDSRLRGNDELIEVPRNMILSKKGVGLVNCPCLCNIAAAGWRIKIESRETRGVT